MISPSKTRKSLSFAGSRLAGGAFLALILLIASSLANRGISRADAVPNWLSSAGQINIGHLGDGSGAVILSDWTEFDVDATGKFIRTDRTALRVLNRIAAERHLQAVGHENNDTKVTSIQTWTIAPSGRVTQSGKKDLISEAAYPDFVLFSDDRIKKVVAPSTEDGALVGYEIVTQGHIPINGERFLMESEIPVLSSELHVSVPSGSLRWFVNYPDRIQVLTQSPTAAVFRAENRPAIPDEDYSPPLNSIAAEVIVNYDPKGPAALQSWEGAGHDYHALFDNGEKPETEIASEVDALSNGKNEEISKIDALYTYVSRQIRYVAVEIGIGGYQPHQAADVFKYKYGDCKDKANLLISMLNHIGIRAYPALVGTRGDIEANPAAPTLATFDHMIVALPVSEKLKPAVERLPAYDANSQILWIDPTSESDPLGQVSEMDQGVFALIAYPDHGVLQRIPEAPAELNGARYTARLSLHVDGTGTANVEVKYLGGADAREHRYYRKLSHNDILKSFESRVSNFVNNPTFQQATVGGIDDNAQQIQEKFSFSGDFSMASSGDSWFFQPLFLSGIALPEVGPRPRKLVLDIGPPEQVKGEYRVELPIGMRLQGVPSDVSVKSEFGELNIVYSVEGNILQVKETLSLTEGRIPPEQYPAFRTFLNSWLRAERQRLRVVKVAS